MTSSHDDVFSYSAKNPSDWEWNFLLDEPIKFETLNDNSDIQFIKDDSTKILKGFTIKIKNKDLWDANWEAFEKAKNLTNLLSVIYGEFIFAVPNSMKIQNAHGETTSMIFDNTNPNKPLQELAVDLSDKNIIKLLNDKDASEIIYHLANAIHGSYKNSDSAIRELVLAYGDKQNLPKQFSGYYALRNALSHFEINDIHVKTQIQNQFPKSEFSAKNLDKTSAINRINIIVANFHFLHNALSNFRTKFNLIRKTRERNN